MSDMIALLNDLSYIPPNNEQNEPIQEDIGETSNEPTQAKRNEFEELYASANEELYASANRKKFCQFIKGVKLPDGFGSNFKHKIRQRHVDNDPGVSESNELFALACGPSQTPISVNSCVVNGVRFVVHSRDERRTTQNSGICSPGPDGEMYYGQLEQILEFLYLSFKTVLFRVKWFDTSNKGRMKNLVIRNNITQIKANEDDPDVIHVDNSSDLALSTSLNDLEITALHIDGQSIDVDAPPDIIDVVDEDDDIIDEEDPIPHDLADSDDEDLINLDIDDGVNVVYSSEEED
ncbi:hypothetical protein Tco_1471389 [Tanacetum coccineum]